MPFCAFCGKSIGTVRFCPYCGRAAGPVPDDTPTAPRPSPRRKGLKVVCALTGIASMLVVVAASLLPWVSYPGGTIGGIHRDGKIMIVLGLLGVLSGLLSLVLDSKWPFAPLTLMGVFVVSLAIIDIIDVSTTPGLGLSNTGVGLFVGAAAGIAALVSGVGGISLRTAT